MNAACDHDHEIPATSCLVSWERATASPSSEHHTCSTPLCQKNCASKSTLSRSTNQPTPRLAMAWASGVLPSFVVHLRLPGPQTTLQFGHVHDIFRKSPTSNACQRRTATQQQGTGLFFRQAVSLDCTSSTCSEFPGFTIHSTNRTKRNCRVQPNAGVTNTKHFVTCTIEPYDDDDESGEEGSVRGRERRRHGRFSGRSPATSLARGFLSSTSQWRS